jgi:hypothetical protein
MDASISQWGPWRSVLQSEIQPQVAYRPVDIPNCGTWKLWLAVKNGFPHPDGLMSHMAFCSVTCFPRPQLTEKSSRQDRGTFHQLLPAWPAGLPEEQARHELPQDSPTSRGFEATVTSQPCLSWLVRLRKHSP